MKKTSTTVSIFAALATISHLHYVNYGFLNTLIQFIFYIYFLLILQLLLFFNVLLLLLLRFYECIQDFVRMCQEQFLQYSLCCNANACKCVVSLGAQAEGVQYHPSNAPWPNPDIMKTMSFDYTIHDPKYDDISSIYSPVYKPNAEGRQSEKSIY